MPPWLPGAGKRWLRGRKRLRWALLTGAASGDHLSLFAGQAGPHEVNCRSKLPVMGMTLPSD